MFNNLSGNSISTVWREGDWIYKKQMKFLTDNDIWCLQTLYPYEYVPYAEQIGIETIRLKYITPMPVTNPELLKDHFNKIRKMLIDTGIRHGDLTEKNIVVHKNRPYIIDFAESRLMCDPRPDKRPEGDEYWLKKTFEVLCGKSRI